jgi:glycosyltransferase involved in cell wall biosynthesis
VKKIFFIEKYIVELLVENGKPTGGASVQSLVWMKSLMKLNFKIFLASSEDDHRKVKKEFDWVQIVPLYHSRKFQKKLVWFTYRFPKIFLGLKKIKPDYLYTSMPNWTSFYIGTICKILGIKHIIRTANDKNIDFNLDKNINFLNRILIGLSYKYAYLILAQSEFQYQQLKSKYPNQNIYKITNPIEINKKYFTPKKKMEGYIGWVGANFRNQKNLKLLHEIAKSCKSENFKIAGVPPNQMDEETSVYLKKLEKLPNVQFLGSIPRDKILGFFSSSKYLLSTSRYEGFSNAFLEAMMVGVPIASPTIINPDGIISKFNLGFLYDDVEDFIKKINSIETQDYILKSENCIQYLKENHDHIHLGEQLINKLK